MPTQDPARSEIKLLKKNTLLNASTPNGTRESVKISLTARETTLAIDTYTLITHNDYLLGFSGSTPNNPHCAPI